MNFFLFVQKVTFVAACTGTAVLIGALTSSTATSVFTENLNQLLATSGMSNAQGLLEAARSEQWPGRATTTFSGSFLLLVWPFLPLIGAAFSIAIGGEVRNTAKNQTWGM